MSCAVCTDESRRLIDRVMPIAPGRWDVYYRVGKFVGYGKLVAQEE